MNLVKLVVCIPEDVYGALRNTDVIVSGKRSGKTLMATVFKAVAKGIPIPKGHGDLKDADALAVQIAMIRDTYNYYGNDYECGCFKSFDRVVDEIVDAPTIIEADKE